MSRFRSFEFGETRVERTPWWPLLAGAVAKAISLWEAVRPAACVILPTRMRNPALCYPAGCGALCPKTAPRLTLDHITRISKVRCTSKSSHAGTGGSLHEA
jgi:hypothetical protein